MKLVDITKTGEKLNASALKDELDLISSFEDKKIELVLRHSFVPDKVAASFKTGADTYGIYMDPDSDLIAKSTVNRDKVARALLQHEGAHVWLTNFGASEKMVENLSEKHNMPQGFVKQIENIVEDCRIESVWSTVFPGSTRSFAELYKSTSDEILGRHGTEPIDPVEALIIARLGMVGGDTAMLESKIPKKVMPYYDKFATELSKVRNTDWKGTYVVTDNILSIFDGLVDHSTTQKPDNGSQEEQEGEGSGSENGLRGDDIISKSPGKTSGSILPAVDSLDEEAEGSTAPLSLDEANRLLSRLVPTLGDMIDNKSDPITKEELDKVLGGREDEILDNSREEIIKMLENMPLSKYSDIKNIDSVVNEIPDPLPFEKGFENSSHGTNVYGSPMTTYDGPLILYRERIKPNPRIKKMLEDLELSNNPHRDMYNSTSGIRLDIQKLIRYEITKDPVHVLKPYFRRDRDAGAEIWLLLDISSSMEGQKIKAAKKILGSIYDSLDGSRYVDLKMFGFYDDSQGTHVFRLDRDMLMKLSALGTTPTDIAIHYITELMKRSKTNRYKNLFIITDGNPNNGPGTKNALIHLKNTIKTTNIFTIFISSSNYGAVEIFSPSNWYFDVDSMDEVEKVLEKGIKGIVENIRKQLRKY